MISGGRCGAGKGEERRALTRGPGVAERARGHWQVGKGDAAWALIAGPARAGRGRERAVAGWAGAGLLLGFWAWFFSIFFLLSFPNYTQTKLNSNSNLNSILALNQIKEMPQHDATTKN